MATEAVRVYRARCADCDWFGEWHDTYGQAITDSRRHVHHVDAEGPLYGLLALAGHWFTTPSVRRHVERSKVMVDRGTREASPRL